MRNFFLVVLSPFLIVPKLKVEIEGTPATFTCTAQDSIPKTVTDIDGNVYHTVKIGTQIWMLENLKVSRYRNGDQIDNVTNDDDWYFASSAWCYYDNNPIYNESYGKLYNWKAVNDSRNIAPESWHIPTIEELDKLIKFLGGQSIAGSGLKETGTEHWKEPNIEATNSSGFTALPAGYQIEVGFERTRFLNLGANTCFWSSSEAESLKSWALLLDYSNPSVRLSVQSQLRGFSVRCIKD